MGSADAWLRAVSIAAAGAVLAAALAACDGQSAAPGSSPGQQDQLPPYALRVGGDVRVDLEVASDGAARLNERGNRLDLDFNDGALIFEFFVVSHASGLSYTTLEDPPLRVSPVLSPGDGVSDVFAVAWVAGAPAELHIAVFIDTDFRDEIGDAVFIHSAAAVDGEPRFNRIPVDLSASVQGVYHRELVFAGVEDMQPGKPLPGRYEHWWRHP